MGGELYSSLFIGPKECLTIREWILLLVNDKKTIIKHKKETQEYKNFKRYADDDDISDDESDEIFINEWYDWDRDFEKLREFLKKIKMQLVCLSNVECDTYRIGRAFVPTDFDIYYGNGMRIFSDCDIYDIDTFDDLEIFAGLTGDFDVYIN
jgi:hypothetical protein